MKKIILLQKKEGETPLEVLDTFRKKNIAYKDVSMTYAGRLDPMASGLLLVLAGDEVKNKEKYLALNKEYEFKVLFGFATDTYDILGKVQKSKNTISISSVPRQDLGRKDLEKIIKLNLKYFIGKFIQPYPMYSSKTVRGKALFSYARAGEKVEVPSREVFVKSLKLLKFGKITREKLLQNIEKRIAKVHADFRQEEILKIWRNKLIPEQGESLLRGKFFIASFKIKCGSGTYVRSIAYALGEHIDIPALAFSIKRTKIGKWKL